MATALDVAFARRYYRWFWQGSICGQYVDDAKQRARRRGPVVRARYRAAMRDAFRRLNLTGAVWDNNTSETICEVCLRRGVMTLLVKINDRGPISRDGPGDLVCAKCLPEAATRIAMLQLDELVAAE